MVRTYHRKSSRGGYGIENINNAVQAVRDGYSVRNSALKFGVPRKTLERHVKGKVKAPGTLRRYVPVILEFEEQLVQHILRLQRTFYGATRLETMKLADDLSKKMNVDNIASQRSTHCKFGPDWFKSFLQCHR